MVPWRGILWATALTAAIGLVGVVVFVAVRPQTVAEMPVGTTITIMPVAVDGKPTGNGALEGVGPHAPAATVDDELAVAAASQGIVITALWGAKPIKVQDGGPRLAFVGDAPDVPLYSATWSELEANQRSSCAQAFLARLDGPGSGQVMICGGRIDLSKVRAIQCIHGNGEKRTATKWSTYPVMDGLTALVVGFN